MRDRPDAAFLLALAHAAERAGEEAELVARARAIVGREASGGDPFGRCRAQLVARYGAGEDAELLRRLAEEIRSGTFDRAGAAREEMRALLWAITRAKLVDSNPDYLAAIGA